jgi:hypothetical protein
MAFRASRRPAREMLDPGPGGPLVQRQCQSPGRGLAEAGAQRGTGVGRGVAIAGPEDHGL